MKLETRRLIIKELTMDMAKDIQRNSLDDDNKKFVPDEVFETIAEVKKVIEYLMNQYEEKNGPLLYPIITKNTNDNIGYVQIVPLGEGKWEVGYHIAKMYTGKGYATEAVETFVPVIVELLNIDSVYGICLKDNIASARVLEKCGFTKIFDGLDEYQGEQRAVCKFVWKKRKVRENI